MLRLFHITDAPLEPGHSWRQCLTDMIARNFWQRDLSMWYPQVDMAGDLTGIIGSEFPLYNFLIYIFYEVFGQAHWYGRLINLAVSSAGIYFFYKLVRGWLNERTALYASLVLLSSVWFAFSRKIMPDTFSVSLVLMGLYLLTIYLEKRRLLHLLGFGVFVALGVLVKIPALSLLAAIPIMLVYKNNNRRTQVIVLGTTFLAVLPALWWYFYWVPDLVRRYEFPLFFPKSLSEGVLEILPIWDQYLEKFYFNALLSYVGIACAVFGLVVFFRKKETGALMAGLAVTLVFILFTFKTGAVFPTHSYYIVPFVPVLAVLAGNGIAQLSGKWAWIVIALVVVEGIGNQAHDFFIRDNQLHKLGLEELMDNHIPKEALIVLNGGQSPQEMYFANRRGWSLTGEELVYERIVELKESGARFLVVNKYLASPLYVTDELVVENEHYAIYSLASL
jgi:uncharacterized membrane protein (UPF0136 family)